MGLYRTVPNLKELLKQKMLLNNCLLGRNEQDTSHKLYMWHGSLAGNLILVSIILLCLAALWSWPIWPSILSIRNSSAQTSNVLTRSLLRNYLLCSAWEAGQNCALQIFIVPPSSSCSLCAIEVMSMGVHYTQKGGHTNFALDESLW